MFALRSFYGEFAFCEHCSTTYGAKPVEGFPRVRRGKTSVADQVACGSHSTNCTAQMCPCSSSNRISDLFKEHSHLHESRKASSFFSDYSHTRCESATRHPVTGVLRMSEEDAQSHTRRIHTGAVVWDSTHAAACALAWVLSKITRETPPSPY